jgi:hypothetical protein
MKTKYIILIIILVLASVFSIVLWNAFKGDRNFVVLESVKHNFCILIDNRYKYSYADGILSYTGGKNSGKMEIHESGISKDISLARIGDFSGGYKKLVNFRVYEYLLSDKVVLRDTFEIIQKIPVNLVPLRYDCDKIKQNFKKHVQIFN